MCVSFFVCNTIFEILMSEWKGLVCLNFILIHVYMVSAFGLMVVLWQDHVKEERNSLLVTRKQRKGERKGWEYPLQSYTSDFTSSTSPSHPVL